MSTSERTYSDHVTMARRYAAMARVGLDSPAADQLAAAQVEATLAQAEALRLLAATWAVDPVHHAAHAHDANEPCDLDNDGYWVSQQSTGTVTLESRGMVLPE